MYVYIYIYIHTHVYTHIIVSYTMYTEDVVANASVFVHELFLRASDFGTDVSGRLEDSELASLWRLAKDER